MDPDKLVAFIRGWASLHDRLSKDKPNRKNVQNSCRSASQKKYRSIRWKIYFRACIHEHVGLHAEKQLSIGFLIQWILVLSRLLTRAKLCNISASWASWDLVFFKKSTRLLRVHGSKRSLMANPLMRKPFFQFWQGSRRVHRVHRNGIWRQKISDFAFFSQKKVAFRHSPHQRFSVSHLSVKRCFWRLLCFIFVYLQLLFFQVFLKCLWASYKNMGIIMNNIISTLFRCLVPLVKVQIGDFRPGFYHS